MILIEFNGEMQLVDSLAGYSGWNVIEQGVDLPPSDHCTRSNGAWVEDADAKAAADLTAEHNAMSTADVVAMLSARIDDLQSTVEAVAVAVDVPIEPPASGI